MTKATDVIAPSSTQSILQDVRQYLIKRNLGDSVHFAHYDDALRAVWPNLEKDDPYAAIFLSINVYLECAKILGFEVKPSFLKEARKDNYL